MNKMVVFPVFWGKDWDVLFVPVWREGISTKRSNGMKMLGTVCVGAALALLSGCIMFYNGSEEGPYSVEAERNEPGVAKETILRAPGKARWYVLIGPDGGDKMTGFNSLRYYMASNGKTNSLSHATKWAYDDKEIEGAVPVPGTDRWMLAYRTDMSGDLVSLDVRLFTAKKLIAQHEISNVLRDSCGEEEQRDLLRYGVCYFSEDRKRFVFPTVDGDCVLDGTTGALQRPAPMPDIATDVRNVRAPDDGVSLYDFEADRILWTVPDDKIMLSRSDTNTFITCSMENGRCVVRLRDDTGAELIRRVPRHEIMNPCGRYHISVSPSLKRLAYRVDRNGGKLKPTIDDEREDALCVETFEGGTSSTRTVFDLGKGRDFHALWVTDDVLLGTWQQKPGDYNHYEYVVVNARTGDVRILPFRTNYAYGFLVDVATGRACLRPRHGDWRIYDAVTDKIVATVDLSSPALPKDPGGLRLEGVENGIGLMYAGLRSWVIVGWDGKPVKSGPLRRTDIGSIGDSLGHGRLAVSYMGDKRESAVLSTDNRLLIKGVQCHPSPAGRFLIGRSGTGW